MPRMTSTTSSLLHFVNALIDIYRRAQFLKTEFHKMGISASTQNYAFSTSAGVRTQCVSEIQRLRPI